MADGDEELTLRWYARNQHSMKIRRSALAAELDCEPGEVEAALEEMDWRAKSALQERSGDDTWVDVDDIDVFEVYAVETRDGTGRASPAPGPDGELPGMDARDDDDDECDPEISCGADEACPAHADKKED